MGKMQISINAKVLFKMYEYAAYAEHHFKAEIAGWGHYNKDNGIYKLAPLMKQTVSGVEVDVFPSAVLNDTKYDISDMIVQWHSHVFMGVTPSTVDRKNIKDLMELYPALISIIVNCRNEYSAELTVGASGGIGVKFSEPITMSVELVPYYDNQKVDREVQTKCSRPKPATKYTAPVDQVGWENNYGYGYNYNRYQKDKAQAEMFPTPPALALSSVKKEIGKETTQLDKADPDSLLGKCRGLMDKFPKMFIIHKMAIGLEPLYWFVLHVDTGASLSIYDDSAVIETQTSKLTYSNPQQAYKEFCTICLIKIQ